MTPKFELAVRIWAAVFALAILGVCSAFALEVGSRDAFVSDWPGNCPNRDPPAYCFSYSTIAAIVVPIAAGLVGLAAAARGTRPWMRAGALAISLMWVPFLLIFAAFRVGHWDGIFITAAQSGGTSLVAALPFWVYVARAGGPGTDVEARAEAQ